MASGAEVRVVAATRVPLLRRPPPHLEQIPLSLFDVWFLPQPPIQRLFLYDNDGGGGADDYFPSLVESLRSSLADAVAAFFPLAGKLTYVPSTGDVIVDCSPSAVGDGVAFLVAESDGDTRALSAAERHDVPAFLRLVPSLEANELPAPVLAVQATRFVGGGVAVGVAVHHAVADGQSFWRFMDAWSAAARGRPSPPAPVFDRSAIVHPMAADMARRILRKVTPELPLLPTANWLRRTWQHHDTTTLELDRHRIADIKNRIAELDYEATTTASPRHRLPSTFVAVSALVWTSVVRAAMSSHSHPADDARARLVFLADCRPRLDPPVDAAYFGNCVRGCVAEAAARDLAAADLRRRGGALALALVHARDAIERAIGAFAGRPMEAFDTWLDDVGAMLRRRQPLGGSLVVVAVAASPRFEAYAAGDLGWGAPGRVEFVSEGAPDGMVVLTGGRKEASVQVSACLGPEYMEAFRSQVLDW